MNQFLLAWQDVFLPYNCRALFTDFMSAPEESRARPSTELYSAVIADLWPELLQYPINPLALSKRLLDQAYRHLRSIKRRFVPPR